MKRNLLISLCLVLLAATALFFSTRTKAQSTNAERRITQAVDETQLVRLRGNTHPSARPQFDQGAAPADLPMERMMLVLKSGTERVAAFDTFFAQQQDRSSTNYHKWLTPDEFGQQFGVGEADIQTITSWLGSHGFSIDKVSRGRTIIVFSGSASNVKDAFRTEIHKYFVNGEEHWANASDPQIPAALTPAVVGVNTLHNFRAKPMNHRLGTFRRDKTTGKVRPLHPQFNFGTGCGLLGDTCFLVGPGDFAKIYNVPTAATGGSGVTIGIVNDSDILTADAQNFYSIFGISRSNPVKVIPPAGTDPGIQSCTLPTGDECEADIDTQWAGAVAPGATIDLVASATTNANVGQNIAAEFIVDSGGATFQVLSMSFGLCEASLGATGNAFFGGSPVTKDSIGEWQQAASEGISVVVSSGDQGSAGCESPNPSILTQQPATTGLAVNGIASTPFNTAVGGTDFNQFNNTAQFWNGSNTAGTLVSAKGYIPETTWNDSCTNTIFTLAQLGFFSTTQANCNSNITSFQTAIVPVGGSGGASTCAVFSGASCTGGYPQPCWQGGAITASCAQHTGITAPGSTRDLPDISMFAGSGLFNSFYPVCDQDLDPENPPAACNASNVNDIQGFGGTSVSTAAFAGIVALIDQAKGGRQGLLNPTLYSLASTNSCTSAAMTPGPNCLFNDVVLGTNAQPCVLGTPAASPSQCSSTSTAITTPTMRMFSRPATFFVVLACVSFIGTLILGYRLNERQWSPAFAIIIFALFMTCAACGSGGGTVIITNPTNGILTGFDAAAGFDQATGLGSVNVTALINNF